MKLSREEAIAQLEAMKKQALFSIEYNAKNDAANAMALFFKADRDRSYFIDDFKLTYAYDSSRYTSEFSYDSFRFKIEHSWPDEKVYVRTKYRWKRVHSTQQLLALANKGKI